MQKMFTLYKIYMSNKNISRLNSYLRQVILHRVQLPSHVPVYLRSVFSSLHCFCPSWSLFKIRLSYVAIMSKSTGQCICIMLFQIGKTAIKTWLFMQMLFEDATIIAFLSGYVILNRNEYTSKVMSSNIPYNQQKCCVQDLRFVSLVID